MVKKIKLENIVQAGFDRENGDEFLNITEEYVCNNCRHIVEREDNYCWKCGKTLDEESVEHYQAGEKLSDDDFRTRMAELNPDSS